MVPKSSKRRLEIPGGFPHRPSSECVLIYLPLNLSLLRLVLFSHHFVFLSLVVCLAVLPATDRRELRNPF